MANSAAKAVIAGPFAVALNHPTDYQADSLSYWTVGKNSMGKVGVKGRVTFCFLR